MSTIYQQPVAAYGGHDMHSYQPSGQHPGLVKAAVADPKNAQLYRHPAQQQQYSQPAQLLTAWPPRDAVSATSQTSASHHTTRHSTPTNVPPVQGPQEATSRRNSETLVYHSLQIPRRISPDGGNLADFAAQMTCLFWFESVDGLKKAEKVRSLPPNTPVARLPSLAKPHEQFRKWVLMVLSTTQVTQNVILLALLFIYRLKKSTRQIKGRAGSEYRLLIVALMLGNKFLDDNTYTNKTWAEVSAFAVKEIHVMEVEFLSNMRYNLLASEKEWEDWISKLGSFHEYYDRALRQPASPTHVSPTHITLNSPLPSPEALGVPAPHEIGLVAPHVPISISPSSIQAANWPVHPNALSPLAMKPTITLPRKRSIEEDPEEHPAKRLVSSSRLAQPVPTVVSHPAVRPPPPHLTLITNQSQSLPPPHLPPAATQPTTTFTATPNGYPPPVSTAPAPAHVSLPPLQPGMRAMSTVYQQTPATLAPQQAIPAPVPAQQLNSFHGPTLSSHAVAGYATPSKAPSPGSLAPYSNSPMPDQFGSGPAVLTPIAHPSHTNSPSVYLQQRLSPYRPIHHVNTLLYPPPSASLDQYHLAVPLQPTQMHYQPIGRRNDLRTGVVPEFLVYNRSQHQHLPQGGHYPA